MSRFIIFISAIVFSVCVYSQTERDTLRLPCPNILSELPQGCIVQDSAVTLLMQERIAGIKRGVVEAPGYRVQVYSSNRPVQAKAEAVKIEERLKNEIDAVIYIVSAPPFIKVRIGDFLTKQEALEFKNYFIQRFPDMVGDTYIVRDNIKVKR